MAGKKKCGVGIGSIRTMPNALEQSRNRASPAHVVKLYEHLSNEQKGAIADMDLETMLDIKCHTLHNPVINWLGPLYDKDLRVFLIPGRGRIPLDALSVYRTLALPRGDQVVKYGVDFEIESRIASDIFPGQSSTPKISEVFTILKDMVESDDKFKKLWMMYPILDKIDVVHDMNICQFVCDKLHEELSADRLSCGFLFHLQLLYVDSLDTSSLNIDLPEGRCVANIWSKENVDIILNADLKKDGSSFGNLEQKAHLAIKVNLFGGAVAFEQWVDSNAAHNCPKRRKDKVRNLIGDFASGMTDLLGKRVKGLTELEDTDEAEIDEVFEDASHVFDTVVASDVTRHQKRAKSTVAPKSVLLSPSFVEPRDAQIPSGSPVQDDGLLVVATSKTVSASGVCAPPLSYTVMPEPANVQKSSNVPLFPITKSISNSSLSGPSADKINDGEGINTDVIYAKADGSCPDEESDYVGDDGIDHYIIQTRDRHVAEEGFCSDDRLEDVTVVDNEVDDNGVSKFCSAPLVRNPVKCSVIEQLVEIVAMDNIAFSKGSDNAEVPKLSADASLCHVEVGEAAAMCEVSVKEVNHGSSSKYFVATALILDGKPEPVEHSKSAFPSKKHRRLVSKGEVAEDAVPGDISVIKRERCTSSKDEIESTMIVDGKPAPVEHSECVAPPKKRSRVVSKEKFVDAGVLCGISVTESNRCSSSKDDASSHVVVDGKTAQVEQSESASPHKEHRRVVFKSLLAAANRVGTRSSPRLKSKHQASSVAKMGKPPKVKAQKLLELVNLYVRVLTPR